MSGGAKVWYFPDGYLPEKTAGGKLEAHEALMLLNVNPRPCSVKLDFYFSDRPPVKDILIAVPGERVVALRLDHPQEIGGVAIPPLTQYSIRVRADRPIVAQFGRIDTTQPSLAYYTGAGFWEEGDAALSTRRKP